MADKPNILIIWGDDIGITNLSCYSDGLMGYRTPNIDRVADEGVRFTEYYGEQSCTAGREYASESTAATFADTEPILAVAARLGWTTASMAGDWETVFTPLL
jgi:hypothetical protein